MTPRERLADGSVRLSGPQCSHVFRRLAPGLMLMEVSGDDTGALGSAPFTELEAEISRFRRPLHLFLDLSAARTATSAVMEDWAAWMARRRPDLASVHSLASTPLIRVTVGIARHMAGVPFHVQHEAPETFVEAGLRLAADFEARRGQALPVLEWRRVATPQGVELADPRCRFELARRGRDAVHVTIAGRDEGALSTLVLDELEVLLGPEPAALFIDASRCDEVAPAAQADWTAWLEARRARLGPVDVLVSSRYMQVMVGMARELTGTASVFAVETDPARFAARLAQRAGGSGP